MLLLCFLSFSFVYFTFRSPCYCLQKVSSFHAHILNTVNIECHHLSLPLCDNFPNIQFTHAKRIHSHRQQFIFGSSLCSFLHSDEWFLGPPPSFFLLRLPSVFVCFQQTLKMSRKWLVVCLFSLAENPNKLTEDPTRKFTFVMRNNTIHDGKRFEFVSKFEFWWSAVKLIS